jgi:spore coat polysaccharide biosynthesis protein SpsF
MKTAIFITVRTGSSRLPNKALIEIQSLPTIVHLIRRMKNIDVDNIILCTTSLKEDDILCTIAQNEKIDFFRGSVKDKLQRWQGAAKKFNIDFFVTADGDDIFCSEELISLAIKQYHSNKSDFIESPGIICGAFTYGISLDALNKVCKIKDSEDTEMMWTYFKDTGLFEIEKLTNVPPRYIRDDIRMTLDYPDDLIFFQKIINHFYKIQRFNYTLDEIISYLDDNYEIIHINSHLHDEWLKNQKERTNLKLL